MNLLILVVDDEPDVEVLFRQQFRRDLRAGRFAMEFAQSAPMALQRITDAGDRSLILILSDGDGTIALDQVSERRRECDVSLRPKPALSACTDLVANGGIADTADARSNARPRTSGSL
jgi:CheY-like chemotaxis protein